MEGVLRKLKEGIMDNLKLLFPPNVSLEELLVGNEDATYTKKQLMNMLLLAHRLQVIRTFFAKPLIINSGFRTHEHNEEVQKKVNPKYVPNSSRSLHMKGMAADIVIEGVRPYAIQEALEDWDGGLGLYKTFTHVDIRGHKARW